MKRKENKYALIVVGGGHAGIEASLIAHKRGVKTLLVSMDKNSVGRTSCNPAVGGLAKGQMVKEVDVLGGIMGLFADLSTLQSKPLTNQKEGLFGLQGHKLIKISMKKLPKNI